MRIPGGIKKIAPLEIFKSKLKNVAPTELFKCKCQQRRGKPNTTVTFLIMKPGSGAMQHSGTQRTINEYFFIFLNKNVKNLCCSISPYKSPPNANFLQQGRWCPSGQLPYKSPPNANFLHQGRWCQSVQSLYKSTPNDSSYFYISLNCMWKKQLYSVK